MFAMIPVSEPSLGPAELEYVSDCVKSGWVSSKGKYIEEFENLFSAYCGTKYGVATTSGTTALHLALASLGIGPGDEVVLPTFTMIATANAVSYTGASIRLVDSEAETWNIDPGKLEDAISNRTRAILVVHTYGHPADMDTIVSVASKRGIKVVEDAAEAHGAEYKGRRCGSLADVACFSFYANKVVTTGEGGMVVTDDPSIAKQARILRDQAYEETRRFLHRQIGFNYRLTNLQAALGVAQMRRIDQFVHSRRETAEYYNSLLKGVKGITLPPEAEWAKSVYWMYSVLIEEDFRVSRDDLARVLRSDYEIETRPFFVPIHMQPVYEGKLAGASRYPVSETLSKRGINLPSGNSLPRESVERVAMAIKKIGQRG